MALPSTPGAASRLRLKKGPSLDRPSQSGIRARPYSEMMALVKDLDGHTSFATKHSLSLQQTLYSMGEEVLKTRPEVAEIRPAASITARDGPAGLIR